MPISSSALTAWRQVNQVVASQELTGATSAFRKAVTATDFAASVPAFEFGNFCVHVLDALEGQMVYVDNVRDIAVVGRSLWMIMTSDARALDSFIKDLSTGATGVKIIQTDTGPYRAAGQAWRHLISTGQPARPDDLGIFEEKLTQLLERTTAIAASSDRASEQYQALFGEIAAVEERYEELQARMAKADALLQMTREAIFSI